MNVEFDDPTKKIPVAFNSDSKKFDVSLKVGGGGGGGENGATFTPAVSEDGVISWTNDKGLPNPDPVNIKGKDGVDGKDGKNGFDGKDGADGERGTGILNVMTAPSAYIFPVGGKIPIGRMELSTIRNQSGVDKVLVGDIIAYTYYHYHVYYVDYNHAYMDSVVSVKGADGEDGKDGYTPVKGVDYFDGIDGKDGINGKDGTNGKDGYTPVKGVDYFDGVNGKDGKDGTNGYTPVRGIDYYTEADKTEMVSAVIAALPVYGGEVESV